MRFANIQALRFASALAVVVYHLVPVAAYRYHLTGPLVEFLKCGMLGMGVYVFFAISGFVLAHSLRTTPVRSFLIWRMVRLYAPYWALIASILAGCWVVGIPMPPALRPFVNGLLLLPVGQSRVAYILGGVEWSLVYEVFFGIVLALFALTGSRRGVSGGAAIWLALCVAKALIKPGVVPVYPTLTTIVTSPANVPFLLGVLAYEIHVRNWRWVQVVSLVAVPVFYKLGIMVERPDLSLIVIGVSCAAAVLWCAASPQLNARNPLVVCGDWSYGVYLCHPMVIFLVGNGGEQFGLLPQSVVSAVVLGCVAVWVGLMYGCLESTAYRRLRQRFAPAKPVKPVTAYVKRAA